MIIRGGIEFGRTWVEGLISSPGISAAGGSHETVGSAVKLDDMTTAIRDLDLTLAFRSIDGVVSRFLKLPTIKNPIERSSEGCIMGRAGEPKVRTDDSDNPRAQYQRRLGRMIEALGDELKVQGILGRGTTTDLRLDLISLAETAITVCDADKVHD